MSFMDEQTVENEPEKTDWYGRIIGVVYTIAIGFYVYTYLDMSTDGKLSDAVEAFTRRHAYQARQKWQQRKDFQRSVGRMFWHTYTILEGEEPE